MRGTPAVYGRAQSTLSAASRGGLCLVGTPVPLPAGYLEAASAAIDAANSMEHALQFIAATPPTMSDSAAQPSGLLSLPTVYINPNGPVVTRTVGSDSTGGEGFFFR
ncbi:hypothetical protein OG594_45570 [Streptomyces sp. NBC_01214]|uniref:hypothetical protein n=1 Tax=Streptomyces sp. NBC_01214 TaxID=2903777 RepID=UPI0022522088|nr:hypothetical protein [Streptomyces sp. NBC_01214]MCX4808747.1 hypothetical protein [Streptomyces sp. NBC_01214]